jgi:zinc transporter ZupT
MQIIFYCLVGGFASLVGALLIIYFKKKAGFLSDKLTSFAAGVLITIAVLDLIPEAFGAVTDFRLASCAVLLSPRRNSWAQTNDSWHFLGRCFA